MPEKIPDNLTDEKRHKLHFETLEEMDRFKAAVGVQIPSPEKIEITAAIMTLGPWYEDVALLIEPENGVIIIPKYQTLTLHAIHERK